MTRKRKPPHWALAATIALAFFTVVAPGCVVDVEETVEETDAEETESQSEALIAAGPLRVNPNNKRYFMDPSGKTVYLVGSHTWANLQDSGLQAGPDTPSNPPPVFGYTAYLNLMEQQGHNFIRLWRQENPRSNGRAGEPAPHYVLPHPWMRSGPGTAKDGKPKFNLDEFNPAYFQRLRDRVIAARDRNIYVSIMLFEGWWLEVVPGDYQFHPFNQANNVNGINADPNNDGEGPEMQNLSTIPPAVLARQKAYVHKVIDTVNDLPNVLYEVANESGAAGSGAVSWQYHMINDIKTYQNGKPKKHPVGMTTPINPVNNQALFDSPADWISPSVPAGAFDSTSALYASNPPSVPSGKVSILDTDHIGWNMFVNNASFTRAWTWKSFLRGHNPILMEDLKTKAGWQAGRAAMGHTRMYADKMNLQAMTPQGILSTTGYCLSSGQELIVYQPGSGTFNVTLAAGAYAVEWFNPVAGTATTAASVTVSAGAKAFVAPFSGSAVLYLKKSGGPGGTLVKAVNVNGPQLSVDGAAFQAESGSGLSVSGGKRHQFTSANISGASTAEKQLLSTVIWNNSGTLNVGLPVSNGSYQVYLHTWEDNFAMDFQLKFEGAPHGGTQTTGAAGTWKRLGPFPVTVSDGNLSLVVTGGHLMLAGIEVRSN